MPTQKKSARTITAKRKVELTRILDAPRQLVYKVWTEPEHMAKWWGPKGFTNPICEMDVRTGGSMRIVMRGPQGTEYPMTAVFSEVVPPERLVFTSIPRDSEGNALAEVLTIVTFAEHGGKTKLTVVADGVGLAPIARQMLGGMEKGWSQSLDRLKDLVAKY